MTERMATLTYGESGFVAKACTLIQRGEEFEILIRGVRALLLGWSMPVVTFMCARSVDPRGGEEPSTLTYLRGTVLLSTCLSPFYRVLLQALSRQRRVAFHNNSDTCRVVVANALTPAIDG